MQVRLFHEPTPPANTDVARLYIKWPSRRGRLGELEVRQYTDQSLAYAVWLALPRGVRAAFRGAGDSREVLPWDYVDQF